MGTLDRKWWVHGYPDGANCFASGADFPSTDYVDTVSALSDIGAGNPFNAKAVVIAAVTGGTSIQAVVADCDTPTGTYLDKILGPVVLVAAALAGKVLIDVALPAGLQRYVKIVFRNAGANTAGTAVGFFYSGR
jgi:hypothetical protein